MKSFLKKISFSFLICLTFLISSFWVAQQSGEMWQSNRILNWDIAGYHNYLPAVFIYQDIKDLKFYDSINTVYKPSADMEWYALDQHPKTGHRVDKYSSGVAIFQAPLFLVAHQYTKSKSAFPADGYSQYYQLATLWSTLLFVFFGLLILRSFLLFYFRDGLVALALVVLVFGSNLFYYCAYQPGLGHPYSFFLYCAILWLTQKLFIHYRPKYFLGLGLCLGLVVLIRPVDILALLIPLFWAMPNLKTTYTKLLAHHKLNILLSVAAALTVWIPQLLYWKITTGSFIYYSYGSEGFNFLQPEILNGLFSFRKGWFVYAPLLILGFIGFAICLKNKKYFHYTLWALVFYLLCFYINFSWHQWFYGGSYGARVMMNSMPLLGIPICVFFQYIAKRSTPLKMIIGLGMAFMIYLTMFQTWQYQKAIIHWDAMNQTYYWRVFLKDHATPEDQKLL